VCGWGKEKEGARELEKETGSEQIRTALLQFPQRDSINFHSRVALKYATCSVMNQLPPPPTLPAPHPNPPKKKHPTQSSPIQSRPLPAGMAKDNPVKYYIIQVLIIDGNKGNDT